MERKVKEDKYGLNVCVFPSGRKIGRYRNWVIWSNREWAWQFLRRRDDFIKNCDDIDNPELGPVSKQSLIRKLLKKYKLKTYKSYCSNKPPKFCVSSIEVWDYKSSTKTDLSRKFKKGEVLIRFNIDNEFDIEKSINKQLNIAKKALLLKANDHGFVVGRSNQRIGDLDIRIKYIRLLDLLRYKELNQDKIDDKIISEIIYSGVNGYEDSWLRNDVKQAKKYLEKYLEMAALLK